MATGVSGYMALRRELNPHERNVKNISNIMGQMQNDSYGTAALAKLPLMYAMGRESASAGAFDEASAAEAGRALEAQMQMERQKLGMDERKLTMEEASGASARDYQKLQGMKTIFNTAMELSEKGQEGEAVKLLNSRRQELGIGAPIESFRVTPAGLQAQIKGGGWWMAGANGVQTWDVQKGTWREPTQEEYAKLAASEKPTDKPTGHVVQDKNSQTGWSYITEGKNNVPGAPDPYRGKEGGGGSPEGKEFRQYIAQLDGLYKARASVEKGYDPITGQVIPQTQIETAKRTLDAQIKSKEDFIGVEFPDLWGKYRKPEAPAQPNRFEGAAFSPQPATPMLNNAAPPMGESKTVGGRRYVKINGQWYEQ